MLMKESEFDRHSKNTDLQLTTLLDDDLIIDEFRNQNQWFICKRNKQLNQLVIQLRCQKLIQITKRAFKYPFYSCELLVCCESPKILESFFGEDTSLLNTLFSIFFSDQEVNPVLAGYVCNVLFNLFENVHRYISV